MGIDLSGDDVGVAEHHLHRAEIGSAGEQMGGKGVAQNMRADLLGDAGTVRHLANDLPEAVSGHRLAPIGAKEQGAGLALEQQGANLFQVLAHDLAGVGGKGDDPFLVAFAEDAQMSGGQVAAGDRQVDQFRDPQPGGIEQMQHGVVAQCQRRGRCGPLEEGVDLGFTEHLGQALADLRRVDVGEGIVVEFPLLSKKLEKCA